jgi:hypothetical protein
MMKQLVPVLAMMMTGACIDATSIEIPQTTSTGVTNPTGSTTGTLTGTTSTTSTTTTTTTTTTGSAFSTPSSYDCSTMPENHQGSTVAGPARGYHDVHITDDGWLVGQDTDDNLIRVDQSGTVELFVAESQLGLLEQFDVLDNGDLVVAKTQNDTLSRITLQGAVSTIIGGFAGGAYTLYGVTTGPNGYVYVADTENLYRVDPVLGTKTPLLAPGFDPKVVGFNHDGTFMYFGTLQSNGDVYEVEMDTTTMDPIGPPVLFAQTGGDWHDGLQLDACGNMYIAEYWTDNLYRITPYGDVSTYDNTNGTTYGHGIRWGQGVGGWRWDAIYQPRPYGDNKVTELVIGAPSRRFEGTVYGTPSWW